MQGVPCEIPWCAGDGHRGKDRVLQKDRLYAVLTKIFFFVKSKTAGADEKSTPAVFSYGDWRPISFGLLRAAIAAEYGICVDRLTAFLAEYFIAGKTIRSGARECRNGLGVDLGFGIGDILQIVFIFALNIFLGLYRRF